MGNLINGPFETERQARAAAHEVVRPEAGWSILHESQNLIVLERACEAAGIELGVYDRRIMEWLTGFEDSACAVVAGLIARAHAAGKPGPHVVVFDMADSQDTQFVLTEALEMFVFEHREIASLRGRSSARERWADRAEAMRDQAEAAADGAQ